MSTDKPPHAVIHDILSGMMIARATHVAAELGVADLLRDGARSVDDLAQATGTHAPSLYRLLRALASYGIFAEIEARRFEQTPASHLLRSDVEGSLRDFSRMMGDAWRWKTWRELGHSVRTGECAFLRGNQGLSLWDYLGLHPESGELFSRAMSSFGASLTQPILDAYDFSSFGSVADIGGAHGSMLAAILDKHPGLRGVLFDLPPVIERAHAVFPAELADRCELVAGDFFESVPRGAGAYVLRLVVHDWDDEHVLGILRSCRRAMRPDARLLVIEQIVPPGNDMHYAKLLDLEMLVVLGGRERTEAEFRSLFEAAEFDVTRIVPTASPFFVIEGAPR